MAEGILRNTVGGSAVSSAGTHAVGHTAAPDAIVTMARRGIDIARHVPRQASRGVLGTDGSDLIVCMEREHVRNLVILDPTAWARTMTLKELVRRGETVGRRGNAEPVAEWLSRASAGRRPSDLMGSGVADDVADPIGLGLDRFQQTADVLESLLGRTAALCRL